MTSDPSSRTGVVLIVDDEPTNLRALADLLRHDYAIRIATNGRKTLELAAAEDPPDLILLDIEMPDMTGYEVCRRLKSDERTSGIPVIFVTARNRIEDQELGFNLGAVDYIAKPFHPTIVRARVRNHMNLKIKTDLLEKLSMQDGLTDIPNRRRFDERLVEEWARASRNGQPLSLAMMDIDHFKPYNDHYGHGAGDECLRRVARALQASVSRPPDFVARYGGEEFVALMPDTDGNGARHVAERLRRTIEALAIPHQHSKTAAIVTLSIGVATRPTACRETDRQRLLELADQALYRAKQHGRNQTCLAQLSDPI
ncbi:diguanylate cyclase [Thioalkalicoccus limnaeus]|uniref:diguanylate cyclase n=1 Tax=Thioalkalicoccus limnaeus TaxID=120681 RepID=A0ABV4BCX9_9GAMM